MLNERPPDNQPPDSSGEHGADGGKRVENTPDFLTIESDEFQTAFGEPVENTLNMDTWQLGEDLAAMYATLERQIADAVEQEGSMQERIRSELFPVAFKHPQAPAQAGCYTVDMTTLEQVHRGLLFNGNVEACDGTSSVHDTLPITIGQIGVALVSYQGNQGTWVHRLYRRDLRVGGFDPIEEALVLLENRRKRDSTDAQNTRDRLSDFTQRGIMAYGERAILWQKSSALWRMGHGHPVPYELLTGGGLVINGQMPLLEYSMNMWREWLLKDKRWVFVTSAPSDRVMLTLGNALRPLEFALVRTPLQSFRDITAGNLPTGKNSNNLKVRAQEFVEEIGPQIVIGLYRASAQAPVRLFYAHKDYACLAATIAIADSVLQEHRGFPLLIDLADMVCRTTFGSTTFHSMVQQAYAEAGAPFRYLGERETRG